MAFQTMVDRSAVPTRGLPDDPRRVGMARKRAPFAHPTHDRTWAERPLRSTQRRPVVDLLLSPEDIAFRDEVRRVLAESLPHDMRRSIDLTTGFIVGPEISIHFHRLLAQRGWSVPHWPLEHGGTGWTPVQRYIFDLEWGRAGAPLYNASGSHFVGPVIIYYGTPEQKERYLPRI